jgi:hypothetical protein
VVVEVVDTLLYLLDIFQIQMLELDQAQGIGFF